MPAHTSYSESRDEVLPYRYESDGIEFGISGFSFDGGESGNPSYDDAVVELYEYGDWDEVTIEAELTPGRSIERVFPEEEGPPFPADLVLVVDCEETQTRFEVTFEEAPVESESVCDEFTLQRDLLMGDVTLTPRLVRSEECREGLPYAPNSGMRVAGGRTWTLEVDEPGRDTNGFPFVYRDFSQDSMPSVDLAHSFSQNPNPKMMVNNQNTELVNVLQAANTYGFRPNLKRVIKSEFGNALWIQLVFHTATTIAETDGLEFTWQEGVAVELEDSVMGTHLFGEDATYDDIVEELGERVSGPEAIREFVPDLCEAVQLYTETADTWEYFVGEHKP